MVKLNTDASFPFPSLMEIYIEDPDLGTLVHMYQGLADQNELEQKANHWSLEL